MKVGIIGAGWIAEKAAITLNGMSDCEAYAIGSRSIEKAKAFAQKWNIPKAYGSYTELIDDPDINLVYVATPHLITATLGYSMGDKPRIMRPDLCGGALLDLGVYALNFVRMFTDSSIATIDGTCVKSDTGMDLTNAITIVLANGILANIQSSAQCVGDNIGVIAGTEGNIIIDNINNPQMITVNGPDRTYVETIHVPQQITGYEYQFLACRQALLDGLTEPREMPHAETVYIMKLMDGLRAKWDVRYPMD